MLTVCYTMHHFWPVFIHLSKVEVEFNRKLEAALKDWMVSNCKDILVRPKPFNFAGMPVAAIHQALLVHSALGRYTKTDETMRSLLAVCKEILREACHAAEEILERGTYHEKDQLLACMRKFSEQGLTNILAELKPIDEMRSIISAQASQLLHQIRQSIDVSVEDSERTLSKLLPVMHLSDEVWKQVLAEIKILQTSIDLRNHDVGKEMDQALAEFDFKAVRKYLVPQDPDSTFQVQKCEGRMRSVKVAVSSMVSSAKYDLPGNPSQFAQKYYKLESAVEDIGDLLIDEHQEKERLENYANEVFQRKCSEHERAVKDFRTAEIFRTASTLQAFYAVCAPINVLSQDSKLAYENARSSCENMVRFVRSSCTDLGSALSALASGNGEGIASGAKQKLGEVLRFLDCVQECNNTLYRELKSELQDHFEDFHMKVDSTPEEDMKYALAIEAYEFLKDMLQGGLDRHVQLKFEVDRCCKHLREAKEDQDQKFLMSLYSEEEIGELKSTLDRLCTRKNKANYGSRVAEVCKEIQTCVQIIDTELESANYFSVGAHLEAITRIRNRLHKHLPEKTVDSVTGVIKAVKKSFDEIVQKTIDATANQDLDRIDRFCRRFVTAVHYLGKQFSKGDDKREQQKLCGQCEQVHRVLLSFAESKLQDFRQSLRRFEIRKAHRAAKCNMFFSGMLWLQAVVNTYPM